MSEPRIINDIEKRIGKHVIVNPSRSDDDPSNTGVVQEILNLERVGEFFVQLVKVSYDDGRVNNVWNFPGYFVLLEEEK